VNPGSPYNSFLGFDVFSPFGPGRDSLSSPFGPVPDSLFSPFGPGRDSVSSPFGPGRDSLFSPFGPGRPGPDSLFSFRNKNVSREQPAREDCRHATLESCQSCSSGFAAAMA
jgi:hypothetical protein